MHRLWISWFNLNSFFLFFFKFSENDWDHNMCSSINCYNSSNIIINTHLVSNCIHKTSSERKTLIIPAVMATRSCDNFWKFKIFRGNLSCDFHLDDSHQRFMTEFCARDLDQELYLQTGIFIAEEIHVWKFERKDF